MTKKGIVRIRLSRFGRKHSPVYNIVVAQAKKARDKLPIEVIGTYDPVALPLSTVQKQSDELPIKDVYLDFMRCKYWLGTGAQPSDTVARIFKKAGLLPAQWPGPQKQVPAPERKIVRELTEAAELTQPPVR